MSVSCSTPGIFQALLPDPAWREPKRFAMTCRIPRSCEGSGSWHFRSLWVTKTGMAGVVSCFDRVVLTGSFPDVGHVRAMDIRLRIHGGRLAACPRSARPIREDIRDDAMKIAEQAGLDIAFIRKLKAFPKEDRVKRIRDERGDAPDLVHLFPAIRMVRGRAIRGGGPDPRGSACPVRYGMDRRPDRCSCSSFSVHRHKAGNGRMAQESKREPPDFQAVCYWSSRIFIP